jgi:bacterioferritin-associated ferredoxin
MSISQTIPTINSNVHYGHGAAIHAMNNETLKKVKSVNGSCGSCKYATADLLCKMKKLKQVKHYNVCHLYNSKTDQ